MEIGGIPNVENGYEDVLGGRLPDKAALFIPVPDDDSFDNGSVTCEDAFVLLSLFFLSESSPSSEMSE